MHLLLHSWQLRAGGLCVSEHATSASSAASRASAATSSNSYPNAHTYPNAYTYSTAASSPSSTTTSVFTSWLPLICLLCSLLHQLRRVCGNH